MTRGEFLTVHAARNSSAGYTTEAQMELFRANGLDEAQANALLSRGGLYKKMVPDFPISHRRLYEGDQHRDRRPQLEGDRSATATRPSTPRCTARRLNVLISGDMLLPRISTNVAVRPIDPLVESAAPVPRIDPALSRAARGRPRPAFARPAVPRRARARRAARGAPRGAPRRAAAACAASPRAAADVLEVLFRRKLDTSQIFFALGEAIAHLHYLHYDGQLARSVGADGVARFAPG